MNYQKVYNNIIYKAKSENRKKLSKTNSVYIYYENHHILPKCLGGTNDPENLVLLTAREHFICHKLLTYIYPGNRKIYGAFFRMTFNKNKKYNISLKDYAYARELNSKNYIEFNTTHKKGKSYKYQMIEKYGKDEGLKKEIEYKNKISENTKGKKNPMYGISVYEVWVKKYGKTEADKRKEKRKQKTSKSLKGKNIGKKYTKNAKEKNRISHIGKHHSEKTIQLFKEQRKGEKNPMYGKHPISPMKGKHHSEKTIKILQEKAKNRPKLKCKYCNKEFTVSMHNLWHGEKCKYKNL